MKQRKQVKHKAVWLARTECVITWYFISSFKPHGFGNMWTNRGVLDAFCPRKFERITGFKLEPGECKRVTITVKEVKGVK